MKRLPSETLPGANWPRQSRSWITWACKPFHCVIYWRFMDVERLCRLAEELDDFSLDRCPRPAEVAEIGWMSSWTFISKSKESFKAGSPSLLHASCLTKFLSLKDRDHRPICLLAPALCCDICINLFICLVSKKVNKVKYFF